MVCLTFLKETKMNKLKTLTGILLILLSITGLFFWEWKGRELIMTEQVLVTKEVIKKGTLITDSLFVMKGIPKENILEGALTPDKFSRIEGKLASQFIAKNDQVLMDYFQSNKLYLKKNESIFVIQPDWIMMRSSSLRRGDLIEIYGSVSGELLGAYRIAYVKDEADREVNNADSEMKKNKENENILNRENSTSIIDHIEIISSYEDYIRIESFVNGETPEKLILMQRGDQIDT